MFGIKEASWNNEHETNQGEMMSEFELTLQTFGETVEAQLDASKVVTHEVGETIRLVRGDGKAVEVTFSADGAMVKVEGDEEVLLSCTDERSVKAIYVKSEDGQSWNQVDVASQKIARHVGALFGVHDAVELAKGTAVPAQTVMTGLRKAHLSPANHRDDHAHIDSTTGEAEDTGCGQAALRTMAQSLEVYKRQPFTVTVDAMIKSYKALGAADVLLTEAHVGGALVISFAKDLLLDATRAENVFFAQDLGFLYDRLSRQEFLSEVGLDQSQLETMMIEMVAANMAAVFVLSDATVNTFDVVKTGDAAWDGVMQKIVDQAHREFVARRGGLKSMLLARKKTALTQPAHH